MKLGRSFMMFGAPSHRLEAQMQATVSFRFPSFRTFTDMQCRREYSTSMLKSSTQASHLAAPSRFADSMLQIPGVMLISFGDSATHTSEIKFLKQANGLDLGKLLAAYYVYYNVRSSFLLSLLC